MSDGGTPYRTVLGTFPYVFRRSGSRLLRAYVVVGALATIVAVLAFTVSLFVAMKDTMGAGGGTFTFQRTFVILVALAVVGPLLAPVISVARRRRRGVDDVDFDATMGALGFAFLGTLYLLLVISAPAQYRDPATGPLAPVIEVLYAMPPLAGLLPPIVVAAAMWLVHRRWTHD